LPLLLRNFIKQNDVMAGKVAYVSVHSHKQFPRIVCTPTSNAHITNIGLAKFIKMYILTNRL